MNEGFVNFEAPHSADEHWQITSDNAAEWALMKIAEAQASITYHEAERAKALAKWDRYVEQATRDAQRVKALFEAKLHGYLLMLIESKRIGQKKSYRLPSARLQLRTSPPQYEVADEAAFLRWCEAHGLTETIVKPKWAEAKKYFLPNGDGNGMWVDAADPLTGEVEPNVVPGVQVTRMAREMFSVKFADDKEDEVPSGGNLGVRS